MHTDPRAHTSYVYGRCQVHRETPANDLPAQHFRGDHTWEAVVLKKRLIYPWLVSNDIETGVITSTVYRDGQGPPNHTCMGYDSCSDSTPITQKGNHYINMKLFSVTLRDWSYLHICKQLL